MNSSTHKKPRKLKLKIKLERKKKETIIKISPRKNEKGRGGLYPRKFYFHNPRVKGIILGRTKSKSRLRVAFSRVIT